MTDVPTYLTLPPLPDLPGPTPRRSRWARTSVRSTASRPRRWRCTLNPASTRPTRIADELVPPPASQPHSRETLIREVLCSVVSRAIPALNSKPSPAAYVAEAIAIADVAISAAPSIVSNRQELP